MIIVMGNRLGANVSKPHDGRLNIGSPSPGRCQAQAFSFMVLETMDIFTGHCTKSLF
jgi:hypothetical protein